MQAANRSFEGLQVLLVEDNFLVGTSIRSTLQAMGCTVVGPYATADEAIEAFDESGADLGILDINIRGGTSEPVASVLEARGVPYCFVTGYRSPVILDDRLRQVVRVPKPVEKRPLAAAMHDVLEA